ncbi:1511_t:CDS:1, partial [Acaulospora colombiana]
IPKIVPAASRRIPTRLERGGASGTEVHGLAGHTVPGHSAPWNGQGNTGH